APLQQCLQLPLHPGLHLLHLLLHGVLGRQPQQQRVPVCGGGGAGGDLAGQGHHVVVQLLRRVRVLAYVLDQQRAGGL
ncbi:hypothetical protein B484DRAFT_458110, partial [Ochromonadaceae sp. CCMP2298]